MKRHAPQVPAPGDKRYLVLAFPRGLPRTVRNVSVVMMLVAGSNLLTHRVFNPSLRLDWALPAPELYLQAEASAYVGDVHTFTREVRAVAAQLDIPPEWLMAVMYAESRFDPHVLNHKGSGAAGLIQFMPAVAQELGTSAEQLRAMSAVDQLEYVFLYLNNVRLRNGPFQSLTDLYLGILFPRARTQDFCYTLYAKPSLQYTQNAGLDEDKDGSVTISDVDRHLKRLFPTAYLVQKPGVATH
ncbi:MAG: transglycosylase SLT domain-containing protein [Bacteroidia bacterium]|nr:transglycosylase SLT domain-containing protein [Bacteroidia bacterium]